MYAKFGDQIFELLTAFNSISETHSLQINQHSVLHGKPVMQIGNLNLRTLDINIKLRIELGGEKTYQGLLKNFQTKKPQNLIFGNGEHWGLWVLQNIDNNIVKQLSDGTVISRDLSLSLIEYIGKIPKTKKPLAIKNADLQQTNIKQAKIDNKPTKEAQKSVEKMQEIKAIDTSCNDALNACKLEPKDNHPAQFLLKAKKLSGVLRQLKSLKSNNLSIMQLIKSLSSFNQVLEVAGAKKASLNNLELQNLFFQFNDLSNIVGNIKQENSLAEEQMQKDLAKFASRKVE